MKILDYSVYKDGGTISIKTDEGVFCIDNRIASTTKGKIFKGYPNGNDINMIENSISIKKELLNSLKTYKNNFYQESIDNLINN